MPDALLHWIARLWNDCGEPVAGVTRGFGPFVAIVRMVANAPSNLNETILQLSQCELIVQAT